MGKRLGCDFCGTLAVGCTTTGARSSRRLWCAEHRDVARTQSGHVGMSGAPSLPASPSDDWARRVDIDTLEDAIRAQRKAARQALAI